jgi:hypothetical protein
MGGIFGRYVCATLIENHNAKQQHRHTWRRRKKRGRGNTTQTRKSKFVIVYEQEKAIERVHTERSGATTM